MFSEHILLLMSCCFFFQNLTQKRRHARRDENKTSQTKALAKRKMKMLILVNGIIRKAQITKGIAHTYIQADRHKERERERERELGSFYLLACVEFVRF